VDRYAALKNELKEIINKGYSKEEIIKELEEIDND
jgi:hypothetical protein